jgi:hypothetical protein
MEPSVRLSSEWKAARKLCPARLLWAVGFTDQTSILTPTRQK